MKVGRFGSYRSPIVDVLPDGQFRALILGQAIFDLGIFMRGAANSWVTLELPLSQQWIGLVAVANFNLTDTDCFFWHGVDVMAIPGFPVVYLGPF